jgi:hypothetical protein
MNQGVVVLSPLFISKKLEKDISEDKRSKPCKNPTRYQKTLGMTISDFKYCLFTFQIIAFH